MLSLQDLPQTLTSPRLLFESVSPNLRTVHGVDQRDADAAPAAAATQYFSQV